MRRSARNVRDCSIETILLGVRRSSKIIGRDLAKKGRSRMRLLAITLASSITLAAGNTYAQAPAGQAPAPATQKPPAPAPATQKPPAPAPAAPAAQKPAAPAPALPKFQDGFKYAYVNMALIAAQSNDGRAAAEELQGFQGQTTRR